MIEANLNDPTIQNYFSFNNGDLAFSDNLHDLNFSNPIKSSLYVVVLILEGKASLSINDVPYTLTKNDLFICLPNNIIEGAMVSVDFQCRCIVMSTHYVHKIMPPYNSSWDIRKLFADHPVCTLSPEEVTVFCQYYNLLNTRTQLPSVVQEKVISTLFMAFLYDMQYSLSRITEIIPRQYTSAETIVNKFVELLESSYPKDRRVSYYADKINVTPKYLNANCKKLTGMTASALIDQYVIADIEHLMKYTHKSIKEIAAELDFPNQSFFGKYTRTRLSKSPSELRASYLNALPPADEIH